MDKISKMKDAISSSTCTFLVAVDLTPGGWEHIIYEKASGQEPLIKTTISSLVRLPTQSFTHYGQHLQHSICEQGSS